MLSAELTASACLSAPQVVECLSELLRPGRYWTDDARDALFSVLVAMLLDPHMEHIMMTSRATSCLARLLQSYERTVWSRDMDTGKVGPAQPPPLPAAAGDWMRVRGTFTAVYRELGHKTATVSFTCIFEQSFGVVVSTI